MTVRNTNEQNIYYNIYDELPRDVLFEIALRVDGSTLRNFAQSNQRASRICSDPYFRNTWIRYHNQLTFKQRQDIDNILDDMVDSLISMYLLEYEDIDSIKLKIKKEFRINFGRDLRYYLLNLMQIYLDQIARNWLLYPKFADFIEIYVDVHGLIDIFINHMELKNFYMPDKIRSDIFNMFEDILAINGISMTSTFEELVQALLAFQQYEKEWYSLFPRH